PYPVHQLYVDVEIRGGQVGPHPDIDQLIDIHIGAVYHSNGSVLVRQALKLLGKMSPDADLQALKRNRIYLAGFKGTDTPLVIGPPKGDVALQALGHSFECTDYQNKGSK